MTIGAADENLLAFLTGPSMTWQKFLFHCFPLFETQIVVCSIIRAFLCQLPVNFGGFLPFLLLQFKELRKIP